MWGERWGLEKDEGVRERNNFLAFNRKSLPLNVNKASNQKAHVRAMRRHHSC